jgi:hypothetical protein
MCSIAGTTSRLASPVPEDSPPRMGFENVTLTGINHGGDAFTVAAKLDLLAAYTDAASRVPSTFLPAAFDLGVSTFTGSDHPPYSRVTGIYPAGSLITGQMMARGEWHASVSSGF